MSNDNSSHSPDCPDYCLEKEILRFAPDDILLFLLFSPGGFCRDTKRMPHFLLFCFQVMKIMWVRCADNRHRLGHFQSVPFQSDDFFRIIGKQTYVVQTEVG